MSEDVLPAVNGRELVVYRDLRGEGREVLRNGCPDFLTYVLKDGKPSDIRAVEVKSRDDSLRPEQETFRWLWENGLGLPYEVRIVENGAPVAEKIVKVVPKVFRRTMD